MDGSAFSHMPGVAFVRGILIALGGVAVTMFALGFLAGWLLT